jgi:methyl-accepting chemotaxis protein
MKLDDMKISSRLILGFGALGLLIAFMGAVAQFKVSVMNQLFAQVIAERIPKIVLVNDIKGDGTLIADALRNMITLSDTEKITKEGARIPAGRARIGEWLKQLDEQSAGVSQVGEAVNQMDQVTQQNAALVEEMAASASSLKTQAQDLVQVVAVFRLGTDDGQPVPPSHALREGSPRALLR